MALLGSSSSSLQPSGGLTTTFLNNLISNAVNAMRQPINALNSQKDQLNIQKAIYSDLKSKLSAIKTIASDLTSDDSDTVLDNIKAVSSNTSALSATASSSASKGSYVISITNLAQAHSVSSAQQTSSSEPLNKTGTFTINGTVIEVESTDSLEDIKSAINNATYEEGKEITATIVDNRLVISALSTGESNQISVSDPNNILADLGFLGDDDGDGDGFNLTLQSAEDAEFKVNGIQIKRASNTDLTNVIEGVTLNLLKETEGTDTVTLTVGIDKSAISAKVSAFVNNLNSTLSYLKSKIQTTADQSTYTRGALAGETIFSKLRADLFSALRTQITGGSEDDPKSLADIGITVGKGLNISFDTSRLDSVLESNFDGVVQLFDTVMEQFLSILEPFTSSVSSSNILDQYANSVNTKIENISRRIENMETALKRKEAALIKQYGLMYMQTVQFNSQQYSSILGLTNAILSISV